MCVFSCVVLLCTIEVVVVCVIVNVGCVVIVCVFTCVCFGVHVYV